MINAAVRVLANSTLLEIGISISIILTAFNGVIIKKSVTNVVVFYDGYVLVILKGGSRAVSRGAAFQYE
uniref:Uncharacterized protein n=1 Tax=Romanomermis culicivorax TaxID=13658 RepID=A0A915JYI6_ROMCU